MGCPCAGQDPLGTASTKLRRPNRSIVSWTQWVGAAGGTGNTLLGVMGGAGQCLDMERDVLWGGCKAGLE